MSSKNKANSYEKTSFFMLYLILSLTIVPVMNANAILDVDISGQDGVEGFRRINDTTIINAYSDTIPVYLVCSSSSINLSCSPAPTTGYRCNYVFPQQTQEGGKYTLKFEKETGEPSELLKAYYVDNFDPEFSDISFRQSGSNVIANFRVVDKVSRIISDECSGLESVKLMVNDNVVAQTNLSNCAYQGSITAVVPGLEGETKLYLIAKDKLSNTGFSQNSLMDMDTSAPTINSDFSLLINGEELSAFSSESAVNNHVDVKVYVSELNLRSVEVDVSSISSLEGDVQRANCRKVNGKYECLVRNVLLNPESGSISIIVTAEDVEGNVDSITLNKELEMINQGPRVTYLGSADPLCEDQCFVKEGSNKVLARVEAPGGLNANGLFFNFDGRVYPSTCNMTGLWECTAIVNLDNSRTGSTEVLEVTSNSMDDLGNLVEGITSKEMVVDNTKPKFLEKPSTDVNCPTAGQELRVTAKVDEEHSSRVIIKANTSLVSSNDFISSECAKTGDREFDCSLIINNFMSTPTDGAVDVPISLYDLAGNTVNMILRMEVCRADNDIPPNFIRKIEVDDDLPFIDKRVASLIPFRVDVPLIVDYDRRTNNGKVSLNQVTAVNCNEAWVSSSSVMRDTSSNPSLSLYLFYQGVWPEKDVNISCSIDYRMREGNVVYLKPETENVNFTLSAIGEEIGNPGDAVIKKKKVLVKEITNLQDEIKSKKKIDDSLGKACGLVMNIANINTMMQSVKALLGALAIALSGFGVGQGIWEFAHNTFDTFHGFVTTYIWPQGYLFNMKKLAKNPGLYIGYSVKWICSLYNCVFYDAQAIASIGSEAWDRARIDNNNDGVWNPKENSGVETRVYVSSEKELASLRTDPTKTGIYASCKSTTSSKGKTFSAKMTLNNQGALNQYTQLEQGTQSAQSRVIGAFFDEGSMIVDPYKNKAYDGMCFPAQLYNAKKEKQLKCLHIKCIDTMASRGLPIDLCDEQAQALDCLYVEGAFSKTHSGGDILMRGILKVGMALAMNWVITTIYTKEKVCGSFYSGNFVFEYKSVGKALHSMACGLFGVMLNYDELKNFMNSPWANHDNSLPTQYCSGLSAYGITSGDDD